MTERNDPCPCGSGKKYKKCCGKSVTKGGKFTPKPPKPIFRRGLGSAISHAIWQDLRELDGEELVRREAIRKQGFRK